MKKTINVKNTVLNVLYEATSFHGINYCVATHANSNAAFLFDDNNSKGEWYLLDLGSAEKMIEKANRCCEY